MNLFMVGAGAALALLGIGKKKRRSRRKPRAQVRRRRRVYKKPRVSRAVSAMKRRVARNRKSF